MGQQPNGFGRQFLWAMAQPAMLLQFFVLVTFLVLGLWPAIVYPPTQGAAGSTLPTLQTVALGQVCFLMLIFPLAMLRRFGRHEIGNYPAQSAGTTAASTLLAIPFYVAAAYLANATAIDALRTAAVIALLWPLGWAAGAWMRSPSAACAVMIATLLALAGMPAMLYVLKEFLPNCPADWLWDMAPVTLAWQLAQSRQSFISHPVWPMPVWLLIATITAIAGKVAARQ